LIRKEAKYPPGNVTAMTSLDKLRSVFMNGTMGHFGPDWQRMKLQSPFVHLLTSYEPMK
jgi:hypothetical protein